MNANDYVIVIVPLDAKDGGGFAAYVPDLPGCMSDGETQHEAAANAQDAIACWLEANQAMGREAPVPGISVSKMRQKEEALINAMRACLDYVDHADGRIQALETKLQELIAVMKDGNGSLMRGADMDFAARIAAPAHCH